MNRTALQQFWRARPARERYALVVAGLVVGLALLWQLGVAPAWRTLRDAPAQRAAAQQQLNAMQALAAQARALQGQTGRSALPHAERLRALETATQQHLGTQARIAPSAESVQVTLQNAPAPAVAQWLQQVRLNAQLSVTSANLTRSGNQHWSGTLVLGGPGLQAP